VGLVWPVTEQHSLSQIWRWQLDRASFEEYEGGQGVRRSLTEKAIKEVERLEGFLTSHLKKLEAATPFDVESYLEERTMSTISILDVHGLGRFFKYQGNDDVVKAIPRLRLFFTAPFKLSGLLEVEPSQIGALKRTGIRTNNQLLRRGRTAEDRVLLAKEAGIPLDALEKLARLSDLTRMRGVSGIRAQLYYNMGIQTVRQMAQWTPNDLVRAANEYVKESDFEGIATLPKEARFTINLAKRLPQLADFS